ncbi:hypothetical protein [Paenibacillus dendritiformis]|uniref:hypothetical protein n=1 Tax=Paenibacillus dendritiformis TaxID=130049 RepID=UPI001BCCDB56|nr:hypothetical protein [Paenibacillus dendritiformis]
MMLIFTITIKEIAVYGNMKFTDSSNLSLQPEASCAAHPAIPGAYSCGQANTPVAVQYCSYLANTPVEHANTPVTKRLPVAAQYSSRHSITSVAVQYCKNAAFPVKLHVEKANPAKRHHFYASRLGFEIRRAE